MKLVIANKNYSTWSLRPWLVLRQLGVPFEEEKLSFNEGFKERVLAVSGAGCVPVLVDGDEVIWDSMAILEYVAEKFPDRGVWPTDAAARTFARCMVAEMHAGFGALRQHMPMNIAQRFPGLGWNVAVQRDIDRILALWSEARTRFGAGGPFLFGAFCAADGFYAPVVWRFVTHDVRVPANAKAYMDAMLALPAMKAWVAEALQENDFVEMDEPYRAPPA